MNVLTQSLEPETAPGLARLFLDRGDVAEATARMALGVTRAGACQGQVVRIERKMIAQFTSHLELRWPASRHESPQHCSPLDRAHDACDRGDELIPPRRLAAELRSAGRRQPIVLELSRRSRPHFPRALDES